MTIEEQTTQEIKPSNTLNDLARVRAEAREKIGKKNSDESDPAIIKPIEEEVDPITTPTEISVESNAADITDSEEGEIKIGDKIFKTQAEAIKYAEQLEHERDLASAHANGVQEAIAALNPTKKDEPEKEDNFEQEFYTNPKETLKKIEDRAVAKATAQVEAKNQAETMWNNFFEEYPDLSGSRTICENVLKENWTILGSMTDIPKAMKILATKTRSIFQDYNERTKPKKELSNKGGQVVSSGSSSETKSVTHKKGTEDEKPLDFVAQLKQARRR